MLTTMLEASTGNVSEETIKLLEREVATYGKMVDSVPVTFEKGKYGFFIHVPEEMPEGCPSDLEQLLCHAKAMRCDWLMLDCDAEPLAGFPTFEW